MLSVPTLLKVIQLLNSQVTNSKILTVDDLKSKLGMLERNQPHRVSYAAAQHKVAASCLSPDVHAEPTISATGDFTMKVLPLMDRSEIGPRMGDRS